MNRIKIIGFGVLLILFSLNSSAQIRVGAKGGLNIYNADLGGGDPKARLGIHVGGIGEYEITDAISAQAGLLISQKGFKIKRTILGDKFESKTSLTYLDIPLTGMYKFELGNFALYGKGGFNIGIGLSGKSKVTIDGDSESESLDWGGDDGLKRLELGFIIGAGMELNETMQVEFSYNLGLNNLAPDGGGDYKNRVLALSFTYFLTEF